VKVLITIAFAVMTLSGCSSSKPVPPKKEVSKAFPVANRQLAPEPVYSRTRWVQLPEVLPASGANALKPAKSRQALEKPMMFQVINFELDDGTLKEAAQMLAASSRYQAFCDPSFAEKKISINMLGTIHEIANKISEASGVDILIDHTNREVRFVPRAIAAENVL
jgi:hypothetical protein